jgi:hypothetical protein
MSAYDDIVKIAREKLTRGECATLEQGIATTCDERPDLRQRYRTEPKPRPVVKAEVLPEKHWSIVRLEAMAQALRRTSREPISEEESMVRVAKLPEGRVLAAAYRQHQRERTRG